MKFKEDRVVIREIKDGVATVFVTHPKHKDKETGKCFGCGVCKSNPGGASYRVDLPKESEYEVGDIVSLRYLHFSNATSAILLLCVPLLIAVLFPVCGSMIGEHYNVGIFQEEWLMFVEACIGFGVGFFVVCLYNMILESKYPPQIIQTDDVKNISNSQ